MWARLLLFITLQLLWPILRRRSWLIVWVVNPGSVSDIRSVGSVRFLRWFGQRFGLRPWGFLRTRGHGWSLVVASSRYNEELKADREACLRILREVQGLRARRIALNGVIPSALHAHGLWPLAEPRVVREQRAT